MCDFYVKRKIETLQFGHGCDAVEIISTFWGSGFSYSGLQFGHGCDAVEMEAISAPQVILETLQFGHGCDAVEIAWDVQQINTALLASIRPRL